MTVPGGKSQLPDRVMVPVVRPALARVPWAWLSSRPVTAGTVTTGGKSPRVMVTGGPGEGPVGGVVAMMVPWAAGPQPPVAVVTRVMVVYSPALSIAPVAAAWGSPVHLGTVPSRSAAV